MKPADKLPKTLTQNRLDGRGRNGIFEIFHKNTRLRVISSDGHGWEHVSVSVRPSRKGGKRKKLPTWDDMCFVKSLFWDEEEAVIQYHPAKSEYVNIAEVLHLWKPVSAEIPTPPTWMVG